MMQSGMTFIGGPAYRSTTNGVSFDPMPAAPQLACLGKGPDGNLVGCGANWQPDYEAVAKSTDGAASFSKVWRFVELAGPLDCPAGTTEYDTCNQEMWDNVKAQFAATGPTCGANVVPDGANGDPTPKKTGGCCDAGSSAPVGLVWVLVVGGLLLRRRVRS
jgi:uncharacterized protein (TIGR03382 family)